MVTEESTEEAPCGNGPCIGAPCSRTHVQEFHTLERVHAQVRLCPKESPQGFWILKAHTYGFRAKVGTYRGLISEIMRIHLQLGYEEGG